MKKTIIDFYNKKENNEKISVITAYDYSISKIIEKTDIDAILVGDSLGMVQLGYKSTLEVTIDDMIHHGKAVMRGNENKFVIIDMPFLSYHVDRSDSIKNAGRIIKETGAHAVKLEGGEKIIDSIKGIVDAQIPVMGHLGLTPQSVNMFGGFKVQGKTEEAIKQLIKDAKLLEEAGVFSIVLECVPAKVAEMVKNAVNVPIIGIGSGACDGQVLVYQDMLGLFDGFKPKFVKSYADIGNEMVKALNSYHKEVVTVEFPKDEHCFNISEDILEKLY